jgi:sigma-B regulation protein RsbQ
MNSIIQRHNIKISGKGKQPILFAHGFGCDQNMWRFVVSAFEEDYKIILFDYIGSGKSELNAYNSHKYSSLEGYATDILDICKELNLTNVIFIGHSVSSIIGILAANLEPDLFANLILVGPSACYINDGEYIGGFEKRDIEELLETMDKNYIGWANYFAPAVIKNSDRPELAEELAESFCSTDPIIARKFAEVTFLSDHRRDLPGVRVPTLVLQCSDDLVAPLEVGAYIHKTIKNSSLVILQATGHCPHLSDPEETVNEIKNYLKSASISQPNLS